MARGLFAAAAAAIVLAGAEPAEAARPCATAGRTVAANEQARVYTLRGRWDRQHYGCRYEGGRRRLVGVTHDEGIVERVVLAGAKVLVVSDSWDKGYADQYSDVRVFDLVSRRVERRWAFQRHRFTVPASLAVRGATLRADGSAAFVVGPLDGEGYEIHRADAGGVARVAAGPDLDPRSLAAGARSLYWMRAGAPASAPFRPRRLRRGPAGSPRSRCSAPRSRTVGLTEKIHLFTFPSRSEPGERVLTACALRTARRVRLGESTLFDALPSVAALAGDRVLTRNRYYDRASGDLTLHLDLFGVPDGHRTYWRLLQRSRPEPSPPPELHGRALGPDGAAAFLAGPVSAPSGENGPDRYEVHASTRAGERVALDAAADVVPGSFAAGERRIYWRRGGEIRTARWP